MKDATGSPIPVPFLAAYGTANTDQPATEAMKSFVERYRKVLNKQLPLSAYLSLFYYDDVYMLVKAMQLAGTVDDTAAIGQKLIRMRWSGALGDVCWDKSQSVVYGLDVALVKNGAASWVVVPADLTRCMAQ